MWQAPSSAISIGPAGCRLLKPRRIQQSGIGAALASLAVHLVAAVLMTVGIKRFGNPAPARENAIAVVFEASSGPAEHPQPAEPDVSVAAPQEAPQAFEPAPPDASADIPIPDTSQPPSQAPEIMAAPQTLQVPSETPHEVPPQPAVTPATPVPAHTFAARPAASPRPPARRVAPASARPPVSPAITPNNEPASAPGRLAAPGPTVPMPEADASTPTWQAALGAWLASHKNYPDEARRHGEEGRVAVRVTVERSGKVLAADIVRSSGSARLDDAATTMLRNATLPPFVAAMAQDRLNITIQIRYSMTPQ